MHPQPALELEALTRTFGRLKAVDALSLQVQPGTLAGFLGPNGAGKSTTLYMVSRLVKPTSGSIKIFGVDIWDDYKRAIRQVGLTVESPAFYDYLSGRKNLELAARLLGNVSARDIEEILERVGLASRQHDRVRVYSTGMRQRLGIGRALLGGPKLLILDEPTNGLDPEGTQEILSFLREKVNRDGLAIFLSSHLMSEIEEFCDTVFVINKGRLVASGAVRELLRAHQRILRVVFRGSVPGPEFFASRPFVAQFASITADTLEITLTGEDGAALNESLVQAGFRVEAISPRQKTMKEFFLSTTGEHIRG